MLPALRSSGNLAADRRFDYARGAVAEGDHAAAADLLEQTVEIAPLWAPAWFALGEAREALGAPDAAAQAFAQALACEPQDSLGAALRLARLTGATPARPPDAYLRDLFDQYAPRFESHLVRDLSYRGPEILRDGLRRACAALGREMRFGEALDLGCGTGLMARALQDVCAAIDGVDIAPAMAARARASGAYRSVEAGDMLAFIAGRAAGSADLVLAADVFVYCGNLDPVFAQARRALAPGGLFAFTVQQASEGNYLLGADLRYFHSPAYLARLAERHGFTPLVCDDVSARRDRGVDVPGLALVLAAP